jgi:hypothetical protein
VSHGRPRFRFGAITDLRAACAIGALSATFLPGNDARGEATRPFELSWQAPADCPSSGEIEREITRLIGDASRHRATVRAAAEITRRQDDWQVQIRIEDGAQQSERTFEGKSCRAVAKVASLIIALAIEPSAGSAPEAAAPLPPEPPEAPPRPPGRTPPPVEAPLRGFVGAGAISELRLLPRIGFGFDITFGLRLPALSAELRAGAVVPQPTDVPSSSAGGRLSLTTAGVRLCARFLARVPEVFGCASGFLDRVQADGYGVTVPGSATAFLATAAIGPRVDLPLGEALRITLGADATHTFGHANFRLDNVGNVHRTARWGGSARLQFAWLF